MKQFFLKIKRWFRLRFHRHCGTVIYKGEMNFNEFQWNNRNNKRTVNVDIKLVKCDVCGYEFVKLYPMSPVFDYNFIEIRNLITPYYVREKLMPKKELKGKND